MKKIIYFLVLSISAACNSSELNNQIVLLKKKHLKDSIYADSLKKILYNTYIESGNKRDTLYTSLEKEVYVLGNKQNNHINYVLVKYSAAKLFPDFKVDSIYKGKKAPLDLNSNSLGHMFRTVISETYKNNNVNFAGHYIFVKWGCGSPCQASVIVDVKTGKIYDCESAGTGYQYKADSRLLIVNPPLWDEYYMDCAGCSSELYVFDEKSKKFLSRN